MTLSKTLLYSGPVSYVKIASTYIYYTMDGVKITFDTRFADCEMDQIPGVAVKKKLGHKILISFKVPELTSDLAKYALAQPDSNLSSGTLTIDNDQRAAEQVDIGIPGVSGRVETFTFYKCYCVGASEINFANGQQVGWQIDIEAVWYPSLNKWGIIQEAF